MLVDIDRATGSVSLLEATDFGRLRVSATDQDLQEVDAALKVAGWGFADNAHAWLDIGVLRGLTGQELGGEANFESMIRFARSKGWINATNTHVRAHVT